MLFFNIEDPGHGEQYCFIKSLIKYGRSSIKVEVLHNIQLLHPVEMVNGLKLISVADIGIMKLQSLSGRKAQKDIYDLDRITDEVPLGELMKQLKTKEEKFSNESYKSLFDLDVNISLVLNLTQLFEFDAIDYKGLEKRASHSDDILRLQVGSKGWFLAKTHWRRKVNQYCKENNLNIPKLRSIKRSRGLQ